MSDEAENKEKTENGENKNRDKDEAENKDGRVTDAETSAEEYAGDNECPECGEPIIEVRANCPNCGYEYKDSDYSDKEAGSEFVAGSAIDDEGNEIPDHETGGGGDDADDDGSDDDGKEDSDDEDGSGDE